MNAAALIAQFGSPLYVYDLDTVRARVRALKAAITWLRFQPLFAITANPCPAVARAWAPNGACLPRSGQLLLQTAALTCLPPCSIKLPS